MYIISIKIHTIREINSLGMVLLIFINFMIVILNKKFVVNRVILVITLCIYLFSMFVIPVYKYEKNINLNNNENQLKVEIIKSYTEKNYYNCYNIKINKTSTISGM